MKGFARAKVLGSCGSICACVVVMARLCAQHKLHVCCERTVIALITTGARTHGTACSHLAGDLIRIADQNAKRQQGLSTNALFGKPSSALPFESDGGALPFLNCPKKCASIARDRLHGRIRGACEYRAGRDAFAGSRLAHAEHRNACEHPDLIAVRPGTYYTALCASQVMYVRNRLLGQNRVRRRSSPLPRAEIRISKSNPAAHLYCASKS